MLDLRQARDLNAQLQNADRTDRPIDPALPMRLEQARRGRSVRGVRTRAQLVRIGLVERPRQRWCDARWLMAPA
jgi:hypothetical protein